jgi:predicted transcriptional regulator
MDWVKLTIHLVLRFQNQKNFSIFAQSMAVELTDKKLKLIEELGVLHEGSGMQPAAARIMALLMISDRTELTFEEIYGALNMSKSAASNALNVLINTDRVEYITQPGERRRYFRAKLKSMKDGIGKYMAGMDSFNTTLKKILDQRPVGTREFNSSLEELTQFLDFFRQEFPAIIEKWNNRKS